eukprot:PLAT3854.2.p1 GENE.PLAT3854.2~~PLAT3854.2.p1  ORF type:complete len:843 (+),score=311.92 PLAT3854.2:142-2529(+)
MAAVRRAEEKIQADVASTAAAASAADADAAALTAAASAAARSGDIVAARAFLERAAPIAPAEQAAAVWASWADLERRTVGRDEAHSILLSAAEALPGDVALHRHWAASMADEPRRNWTRARGLAHRAVELQPRSSLAAAVSAMLSDVQGDLRKARAEYEAASRLAVEEEGAPLSAAELAVLAARRAQTALLLPSDPLTAELAAAEDGSGLWLAWAAMERRVGDVDSARSILARGAGLTPTSADTLRAWASLEASTGALADAEKLLAAAADADAGNAAVWLDWAALADRAASPARAMQLATRATTAAPADVRAWRAWLSHARRARTPVRTLRSQLETAAAADADNSAAVWQTWAALEVSMRQPAAARGLFRTAARAFPAHAPLLADWAALELAEGNLDDARRLLDGALSLDDAPDSLLLRGTVESRRGDIGAARFAFARALARRPRYAPLWQEAAALEERAGKLHAARKLLADALQSVQPTASLYSAFAAMEARAGNVSNARSLLSRGCQLLPRSVKLASQAAELEASEGDMRAARQHFFAGLKAATATTSSDIARAVVTSASAALADGADAGAAAGKPVAAPLPDALLADAHAHASAAAAPSVSDAVLSQGRLLYRWATWERRHGARAAACALHALGTQAAPSLYHNWLHLALLQRKSQPSAALDTVADGLRHCRSAGAAANLLLAQARIQARMGDVSAADGSFQAAISRFSGNRIWLARYLYASTLLEPQGRFVDALKQYRAATKALPRDDSGRRWRKRIIQRIDFVGARARGKGREKAAQPMRSTHTDSHSDM